MNPRRGRRRRVGLDGGSATVWVLGCALLLTLVAGVVVARTAAVLARHRAESSADLAALAAAAQIGTGGAPCPRAAALAAGNRARLVSCTVRLAPDGRSGTVEVGVTIAARLPLVGAQQVRASARSARLPGPSTATEPPVGMPEEAPVARPVGAPDARPAGAPVRAPRAGTRRASALPRAPPDASPPGPHTVWHAGSGRPFRASALSDQRGDDDEEGERVEVSVSRKAADDIPVVAVSGEVDVYSAPELKESLTKLLESGSRSVVVDLSDVAFLDSTGLGALVEARAATSEAGGSLPIVCSHERILKLFTITGLDGVFSIHGSVDDALASLQS